MLTLGGNKGNYKYLSLACASQTEVLKSVNVIFSKSLTCRPLKKPVMAAISFLSSHPRSSSCIWVKKHHPPPTFGWREQNQIKISWEGNITVLHVHIVCFSSVLKRSGSSLLLNLSPWEAGGSCAEESWGFDLHNICHALCSVWSRSQVASKSQRRNNVIECQWTRCGPQRK